LDQAKREVLSSLGKAACVRKENECLHEYISISTAEEAFLKQKLRNQGLNVRDQYNSYFHRIVGKEFWKYYQSLRGWSREESSRSGTDQESGSGVFSETSWINQSWVGRKANRVNQ
jgi:hypothetical protein